MPRPRRDRHAKKQPPREDAPEPPGVLRGWWVPFVYAILSLVGAFLALGRPDLLQGLALPSGTSFRAQSVTGLLTSPLFPARFVSWAAPLAYIVLASYLLRRELSDGKQLFLALAGAVVGGLAYELLTPAGRFFAGGMMVAWAFCGAAAFFGLVRWRSIPWPWRVYTVAVGIVVLARAFETRSPQSALSVAALVGILLVAFWTWRTGWTRRAAPDEG